ncbi:PilZ domain-containing protein [Paludibaculum fermentans]|uniref:PilZ domain-containing protein n=1 Tax=Paludibaculum fermentans TaxID=1473598 RepID=UPI003EC106DF
MQQPQEGTSHLTRGTKVFYWRILRVFASLATTGTADNLVMTRPVRKFLRVPSECFGTLELLAPNEPGLAFGIRVTDVSSTGVGITLRGEIPLGTRVRLIFDSGPVEGEIVHCRAEKSHYFVGVRVEHNATALARLRWAASLKLHDAVSSSPRSHVPV